MTTRKRFYLMASIMMLMAIPLLLGAIMPTLTALADGSSSFIEHPIAGNFDGARTVYATDVDGDGDVDVLGAAYNADDIAWWENDGSQNFTEHTIADNFDGACSVYATDLDGDGDVDVLGAACDAGDIAWWENDGSENFTEHTIAGNFGDAYLVYAADLDGDGDLDILGTVYSPLNFYTWRIIWWENDGSESFTAHTISSSYSTDYTGSIYATDLDGDGDIDVLVGGAHPVWWENDGNGNFTAHTIDVAWDTTYSVYAADLDSDGDMDVLGAAYNADDITWWENDGSQNFTEHTIAGNFDGASSAYAADVDSDNDMDVLGTAAIADDITWWENDGSQNFTEHTIAGNFDGAESVYATDVDGDGDVDILGAASVAGNITWWEQGSVLSINDVSVTEGDSGSVSTVLSVTLSITSTQMITVEYATADGSAVAPFDYTAIPTTTLIFAPGVSTRLITVSVQGDTVDEPDETFWVNLANPINAGLGDAQGQGTILDDDFPELSFSSATYSIDEDAGNAIITVTLSAASDLTVTVNYTASDGTATSGTGMFRTYTLEEDEDLAFSSPATRYTGSDTTWNASGQAAGTYYYRVRASNPLGGSGWSNVQSVKVGPPDTPVLNPISNPDGNGSYTVSWNEANGAQTYTLEEDDNPDFSSPITAYSGPGTSAAISGRDLGTYYYRVKASNGFGSSDWSNIGSVEVTVLPSCSPMPGSWSGTGSWPVSSVSFAVSSDSSMVTRFGMSWTYPGACGHASFTYLVSRLIDQNCHFYGSTTIGSATFSWTGDFTSSSTATGTWRVTDGICSTNGTWQATGPSYYQVGTGDLTGNSGWSSVQSVTDGPPDTPVLYPISNPDGDGNYTVSWIGGDYTPISGTLTFAPGQTMHTFTIPIADDTLDEDDETVHLALSNPTSAALGTPDTATLTILDDDPPPTVQFSSATYSVDEEAGTATITATLSAASGLTVTVDYAASDGTATAGEDYTAVSGTLTFAPGVTSRNFTIAIIGDEAAEGEETVILTLSNADNATIGVHAQATLTITEEFKIYLPLVLRQFS